MAAATPAATEEPASEYYVALPDITAVLVSGEEQVVQLPAKASVLDLKEAIAALDILEVLNCQVSLTRGDELLQDGGLLDHGIGHGAVVTVAVSPITEFPCTDKYPGAGSYKPNLELPPVPPFPCKQDSNCTPGNRICKQHSDVLFVKTLEGETYELPWSWEVPLVYKCWLRDRTGIAVRRMRLIFAGAQLDDSRRHSGMQYGSTLHLVPRK